MALMKDSIKILGAREHNPKDLDLEIPKIGWWYSEESLASEKGTLVLKELNIFGNPKELDNPMTDLFMLLNRNSLFPIISLLTIPLVRDFRSYTCKSMLISCFRIYGAS